MTASLVTYVTITTLRVSLLALFNLGTGIIFNDKILIQAKIPRGKLFIDEMDKLRKDIATLLSIELENYFLWFPAFIAIGILIFFILPFDPSLYSGIIAVFMAFGLYALSHRYSAARYAALIGIGVLLGYAAPVFRTEWVKAPVLPEKLEKVWVTGDISEINNTDEGQKLTLDNIKIKHYTDVLPAKVKISTRHADIKADIGDRVGVRAVLLPPPEPSLPAAFDYQQYAWFKQIGAIGYAVGRVKVFDDETKITGVQQFFSNIRQKIENRIFAQMDKPASSVAVGILVGDSSAIGTEVYEEIRKSGLAHIIAISGMHIVVVVGLIFFSVRFLLSRSEKLMLRLDLRKTSALVAIIGSFVYLLIAGSPLSAQRAFIMSAIVLTAILIDRNANPMRSVAITSTIILLSTPEAVLNAGLQMSMAASIALISSFAVTKEYFKAKDRASIVGKSISYFFAVLTSTLVAGLATSPFIIYHFNQFSTYSVLSNLIAVPLSDFVIMPAGMIAMLLMPLGIEKVALVPMQWGIDLMLQVSHLVASLPNVSYYVPGISTMGLITVILGGLILCLFSTKLRLAGVVPILLGLAGIWQYEKPDIIVSGSGKLFAIQDKLGTMAFSTKIGSRFNRKVWQQATGENYSYSLQEAWLDNCRQDYCAYSKNGRQAQIVSWHHDLAKYCSEQDLFINLVDEKYHCEKAKLSINLKNLRESGTHTFSFSQGGIKVNKVADHRPRRIWNRKDNDRF